MKIVDIDTLLLRVPTPHPICLAFPENRLVVVNIRADEGPIGFGYTIAFGGGGAEAIQSYIETRLKPLLIGENPTFVERLWERMYRGDRGVRRVGLAGYAVAALDIALWDLVGKAASLPLHKLWGAVSDRIPAYGSGGYPMYPMEELVAEAQRYVAAGCRYYKMKIHDPDPQVNRRRVETLRKALGDQIRIMVDVNQKCDVLGAIRQAELLQEFDLLWYEEPVLADDIAACAEVARAIRIPVATGENNYTRFEFREILERKAARYLMPDVCRGNGFSETLKIGHLAGSYQTAVTPHTPHELSLPVLGALSNGFLAEYIDWAPADLFEGMPRCEDGCFRISDRPGHGIALAPGADKKYRA
jgi:L-alanine-DL-glutamate epimerase-like enolase superfamily enzyme